MARKEKYVSLKSLLNEAELEAGKFFQEGKMTLFLEKIVEIARIETELIVVMAGPINE